MASNAELKKQILELDKDADVDGLNNADRASFLSELKAKAAEEAEAKAAEEAEAKAAEEAEAKAAEEVEKKPPYSVAMGKAITTPRGILADGEEIKATDLTGGQKTIDAFVKSGHICKG